MSGKRFRYETRSAAALRDAGGARAKHRRELHREGDCLRARAMLIATSMRTLDSAARVALARFTAAVAFACVAIAPSRADAYCRGLTQAGPDPASTHACFAGGPGIFELYWRNRCVGYSLQKDASAQVSLAQATPIAAQAFAAWTGASCGAGGPSVQAVDEGPVACGSVGYHPDGPNQHTIVFRDDGWPHNDPNNALALTTITYDERTGEIYDADIEINSHDFSIVPEGPTGQAQYDLLSILTHEAGHFLGLAHSADASAVMYTFYRPGSTSLTSDDVAGICSIYPPDGTRSTSAGVVTADACDPTPRHGFASACSAPAQDAGVHDAGATAPLKGASCAMSPLQARSDVWVGVIAVAIARVRRRRRP
jgi:hypothetical protein